MSQDAPFNMDLETFLLKTIVVIIFLVTRLLFLDFLPTAPYSFSLFQRVEPSSGFTNSLLSPLKNRF